MDKFSELKATIPANVKSREAVAAGFVTHNNTGGYFVIECQECGAVYPSQQADGGGQIADTGDYDDAICPHCGEESPEECENVGLAWNVQQAKITVLLAELEAKAMECRCIEQERALFRVERTAHQQHAQELEKRITELEAKLATPVRLPEAHSTLFRQHIRSDYKSLQAFKADEVIATLRAAGFTVEGDE